MAGPDPRAPVALDEPGSKFLAPLRRDFRKVRVAWSRDLGGLPMDPRVVAVLERQREVFVSLGCIVEEAEPDFSGRRNRSRRCARSGSCRVTRITIGGANAI
jgi:amidase